jgi:hypothetical protein
MADELKYLMPTRIATIQARLGLLRTYTQLPKTGNLELENFSFFDDRIFPVTNHSIEQYKKLVKVGDAKLAANLEETRVKKFDITKMQDNPHGTIVFKRIVINEKTGKEVEIIKNLSKREWWTIGAAGALCDMLAMCSGYIYWFNMNKDATYNQRAAKINEILSSWNGYFVEFATCLVQINSTERSKGGKKAAQKKEKIKVWVLEQAHQIYNKNIKKKQKITKKAIADMVYRDLYNPDDWDVPLKIDSELPTIYRWILNDKSIS